MVKHVCDDSKRCRLYGGVDRFVYHDCYAQYQWNKKMQALLAKEPKSMKGFTFMPKGEVT